MTPTSQSGCTRARGLLFCPSHGIDRRWRAGSQRCPGKDQRFGTSSVISTARCSTVMTVHRRQSSHILPKLLVTLPVSPVSLNVPCSTWLVGSGCTQGRWAGLSKVGRYRPLEEIFPRRSIDRVIRSQNKGRIESECLLTCVLTNVIS